MNWSERYAASKKEVKQHIKTLQDRGWKYLGTTGAGHHKMQWPHAPQNHNIIRFSATPSDPQWLSNSKRDAQFIERNYPAPRQSPQSVQKEPSAWDIRLQMDTQQLAEQSRARQQQNQQPLSVQEKMRLKRQQRYSTRYAKNYKWLEDCKCVIADRPKHQACSEKATGEDRFCDVCRKGRCLDRYPRNDVPSRYWIEDEETWKQFHPDDQPWEHGEYR